MIPGSSFRTNTRSPECASQRVLSARVLTDVQSAPNTGTAFGVDLRMPAALDPGKLPMAFPASPEVVQKLLSKLNSEVASGAWIRHFGCLANVGQVRANSGQCWPSFGRLRPTVAEFGKDLADFRPTLARVCNTLANFGELRKMFANSGPSLKRAKLRPTTMNLGRV